MNKEPVAEKSIEITFKCSPEIEAVKLFNTIISDLANKKELKGKIHGIIITQDKLNIYK